MPFSDVSNPVLAQSVATAAEDKAEASDAATNALAREAIAAGAMTGSADLSTDISDADGERECAGSGVTRTCTLKFVAFDDSVGTGEELFTSKIEFEVNLRSGNCWKADGVRETFLSVAPPEGSGSTQPVVISEPRDLGGSAEAWIDHFGGCVRDVAVAANHANAGTASMGASGLDAADSNDSGSTLASDNSIAGVAIGDSFKQVEAKLGKGSLPDPGLDSQWAFESPGGGTLHLEFDDNDRLISANTDSKHITVDGISVLKISAGAAKKKLSGWESKSCDFAQFLYRDGGDGQSYAVIRLGEQGMIDVRQGSLQYDLCAESD